MNPAVIRVSILDRMGTDLTVVNAARVSMAKQHAEFLENDADLIAYLAKNGHWSPFAHCFMQFRIRAPIFVARQLAKSQVGLAWNEVSRRYIDTEPEFYVPEMRERAKDVKQGSKDAIISNEAEMRNEFQICCRSCLAAYNDMLDYGVAPEVARAVLPQAMMTEWIWSGSLYAFARVCNLRLDPHAQKESRIVAKQIFNHMQVLFPVSTKVLVKEFS